MVTQIEKHTEIKGTIVVVDDNPSNLEILEDLLTKAGYKIRSAISGPIAITSIQQNLPDLILLDIQMPELDGYQVCERLKANEKTKEIPIIFISALNELHNKVKGFQVGAVDYISKPFQFEEVLIRVQTHLTINKLTKQLETQNKELIEAGKFREDVERITRHDLKGPLTAILSFPRSIRQNETLSETSIRKLNIIEQTGRRMLTMLNRSLDLFKMEKGIYYLNPVTVDIVKILNDIMTEVHSKLEHKNVSVSILLDDKPLTNSSTFDVLGEELLCYTMLDNLVNNAIEASVAGDTITLNLELGERRIIHIHNPAAVPESIRDRFFEKYVTNGKMAGTGLGTYSAMLSAKTQKGGISLESSEEEGTTVTIHLNKPGSDS